MFKLVHKKSMSVFIKKCNNYSTDTCTSGDLCLCVWTMRTTQQWSVYTHTNDDLYLIQEQCHTKTQELKISYLKVKTH